MRLNQKGHLITELAFPIIIWGIYLALAIPTAMVGYESMKQNGHTGLFSLAICSLLFPGPLFLSFLAGSIHFYIKYRHSDKKPWLDILSKTTFYLGCLLLLAIFLLIANKIM